MSTKTDLKKVERMSKALGDPYRIQIMQAINKKKDWMPCTAIVDMLNLAQSTVSHHMKQLVEAELVEAEKDGRHTRYRVNCDAFNTYVQFLSHFKE